MEDFLTVDEYDLDHGYDEEGQCIHGDLHQYGGDEKHQQDDYETAQDPNRLGDPAKMPRTQLRSEWCLEGWGRQGIWVERGSPLVEEGVEAGEDQQGQHGTQGHDIIEDGTEGIPGRRVCQVRGSDVLVQVIGGSRGHILGFVQAVCEILQGWQTEWLASLAWFHKGRSRPHKPSPLPPISPEWLS